MNRPTKFRVWLPSLNRFSVDNSVFINCYGKLYGVTKPSLVDDSQSIVNIGQFKELDGYTIQWYTGLTDKNGKEIFEGDIVYHKVKHETHDSTYAAEVVWKDFGWCLTENREDNVPFCYLLSEKLEVIGNIFQLPCKPDHNGECIHCDCWMTDCPFIKSN